jgi:hypothetical protein
MEQAFPCSVSCTQKSSKHRRSVSFACKTKTRAEIPYPKFVTELLRMAEGTQHDSWFSRRSPAKKERKQLLATKETQRDGYGDIEDNNYSVHNLNSSCKIIFEICALRAFQWYKEGLIWTNVFSFFK